MNNDNKPDENTIVEFLTRVNPTKPSENDALNHLAGIDYGVLGDILWRIINSTNDMRFRAMYVAFELQLKDIEAKIIQLLSYANTKEDMKHQICSLIGDLHLIKGMNALVQTATQDDSAEVRMMAVHSLGKIGNKDVLPTLEWIAAHDTGQDFEGRKVSEIAELAIKDIYRMLQSE